tara:strand:+ start:80 stop:1105 length:1026 start_codon:yes stop_codon:yes gene_type:complete
MKVNISLQPRKEITVDQWCPTAMGVRANPSGGTLFVQDTEKRVFRRLLELPKNEKIELYNNGEPSPWGQKVADTLVEKFGYTDVKCVGEDKEYFNRPDKLFDTYKPYAHFDIGNFKKKFKETINLYKSKKWNNEEFNIDGCGHSLKAQTTWTVIRPTYNLQKSNNLELMENLFNLLTPVSEWFENIFYEHDVPIKNVYEKLTIRLLDYNVEEHSRIRSNTATHLDSNCVTALMYQDAPSINVYNFDHTLKKSNITKINVDDQRKQNKATILPGYYYANDTRCFTPPCWHKVDLDKNTLRRVSITARVESNLFTYGTKDEYQGLVWDNTSREWVDSMPSFLI